MVLVEVQYFGIGTNLVTKRLKLKVRKFWRPVLTFVEVTGEKLVGGDFLVSTPILNRDKYFLNLGIPS